MRKSILLIVLLSLIVSLGIVVSAQDEAAAGDDANSFCLDGTWYCPDPNDAAREEWNWTCGWYFGNRLAGEISIVPEWCFPPQAEYADGTCDVDLAGFGLTSAHPDHSGVGTGWDIWSPGMANILDWVASDPGLPDCFSAI